MLPMTLYHTHICPYYLSELGKCVRMIYLGPINVKGTRIDTFAMPIIPKCDGNNDCYDEYYEYDATKISGVRNKSRWL